MSQHILKRLWIYQSERFPLKKTVPLLAVFSAASICVSAQLAGRDFPGWEYFIIGFILAMTLFFQMRVCDEYKDFLDDKKYRPERPIPRGLVSLRTIIKLGVFTLPLTAAAAWLWHISVFWLLLLVWVWLAAMTAEFGVPRWLKSQPIIYLLSHMAIMPLIDLMLTGIEWIPGGGPAPELWMFLALSFVNGCVLEIGRKLWAPTNEIEGVETYSSLWGPRHAAHIWLVCVGVSYTLLVAIGYATGVGFVTTIIGAAGFGVCFWVAMVYLRTATPASQTHIDTVAGLWVFLCYGTAGFLPYIVGAIS